MADRKISGGQIGWASQHEIERQFSRSHLPRIVQLENTITLARRDDRNTLRRRNYAVVKDVLVGRWSISPVVADGIQPLLRSGLPRDRILALTQRQQSGFVHHPDEPQLPAP